MRPRTTTSAKPTLTRVTTSGLSIISNAQSRLRRSPVTLYHLARVYIDTQRYEDAIKTCQRALAVRSDYAKTYYTLGLAHLAAGDRESAIHDHRVLLTLTRDLAKKLYEAINK
jgi:tetratricopeptide (TPR) repeat protein